MVCHMGASLCVNKVALAQNLGLEYCRCCHTLLDAPTVRRGGQAGGRPLRAPVPG